MSSISTPTGPLADRPFKANDTEVAIVTPPAVIHHLDFSSRSNTESPEYDVISIDELRDDVFGEAEDFSDELRKLGTELFKGLDECESLTDARIFRGLTQSQLAESLELQQPYVSRIERGKQPSPGIQHAKRWADALELSLDLFWHLLRGTLKRAETRD